MNPYIDQVKAELEKNPPNYGFPDANSLIEMLYLWYVQWNPVNTERIRTAFFELESYFCGCSRKQIDEAMDIVSRLCSDHEQAAFLEGLRVGVRLASEL